MQQQPLVRVVVVEDNDDDRELLIRQLRKVKIDEHVKFFSRGEEALKFFMYLPSPQPFCDLIAIFLDLKLPRKSGIEVLREIRKMPRVKDVPVVILTSSLDPKDFELCQDLRVSAFIPKPITFNSFSKAIAGLPPFAAPRSGKVGSYDKTKIL